MFNFGYFRNGAVWTAFFGSGAVFFINKNSKQVSQNAIGHFGSGKAEDKRMTNSLQVRLIPTSVCRTKRGQIVGQVVRQTDAHIPKIVGTETAPLRCPASEKQHRNGVAKKRHHFKKYLIIFFLLLFNFCQSIIAVNPLIDFLINLNPKSFQLFF